MSATLEKAGKRVLEPDPDAGQALAFAETLYKAGAEIQDALAPSMK